MIDYEAMGLPDQILHAQLARPINAGHPLGIIVARYLTDLGSHAVYLSEPERAALEQPTPAPGRGGHGLISAGQILAKIGSRGLRPDNPAPHTG
jgi:hypothetical protein